MALTATARRGSIISYRVAAVAVAQSRAWRRPRRPRRPRAAAAAARPRRGGAQVAGLAIVAAAAAGGRGQVVRHEVRHDGRLRRRQRAAVAVAAAQAEVLISERCGTGRAGGGRGGCGRSGRALARRQLGRRRGGGPGGGRGRACRPAPLDRGGEGAARRGGWLRRRQRAAVAKSAEPAPRMKQPLALPHLAGAARAAGVFQGGAALAPSLELLLCKACRAGSGCPGPPVRRLLIVHGRTRDTSVCVRPVLCRLPSPDRPSAPQYHSSLPAIALQSADSTWLTAPCQLFVPCNQRAISRPGLQQMNSACTRSWLSCCAVAVTLLCAYVSSRHPCSDCGAADES